MSSLAAGAIGSAANVVEVRWLAVEATPESLWAPLSAMLDNGEKAKAESFRISDDRRSYVAAHALARSMLGRRLSCAPANVSFVVGENGKPEIANAAGAAPLRFSLSHTRGMAAVAVAWGLDVGIDVELIDSQGIDPAVIAQAFAPTEISELQRLPPLARSQTAFELWTLKEAYSKATGQGLTCPFDGLAFTLSPLKVRFSPAISDDPTAWMFRRWRPQPSHALALAVRHNPSFTLHTVVCSGMAF